MIPVALSSQDAINKKGRAVMSVICWDGKSLAADRQATDCDMPISTVKIRKIESGPHIGHVIAWTGCDASGTYLADW